MKYPDHPGYARGSDTSYAAAVESEASGQRQRQLDKAFELLLLHEPRGVTNDELQRHTGWPMQSCSARMRELVLRGKAYDTTDRRPTRYGRSATVRRPVVEDAE